LAVVSVAAAMLGASPSQAQAASYTVRQCDPAYTTDHEFVYPYVARSDAFFDVNKCSQFASLGLHAQPFKTVGTEDGNSYIMWAPEGTRFSRWKASFQGGAGSSNGVLLWARACYDFWCTEAWSDLFFGYEDWSAPKERQWTGSSAVTLKVQMICTGWAGPGGCALGRYPPGLVMYAPEVGVDDLYAPDPPKATGGSLLGGGWKRGTQTLALSARDTGGGVSETEIKVGGVTGAVRRPGCAGPVYGPRGPAWTRLRPCPTQDSAEVPVNLSGVADGPRPVEVTSRDPAGQATSAQAQTVLVDNTPPGAPAGAAVDGGEGWRRHNSFAVHWENPAQQHAPIAAVHWRLCPLHGGTCASGRKPGGDISRLEDLAVTSAGENELTLWLEDEAGNQDPGRARRLRLRLDNEPPDLAFLAQDPADPLKLVVSARDSLSGLADGEIEMRRLGDASWHPVEARVEGSQLVGSIDDERFPDGSYQLRARARDAAGNEASTDRREDGASMAVRLPLRVATRMRVGVPRTRRRHGRRVLLLSPSARVAFGRHVRLRGTLRNPDGQPIDDATIYVLSKTAGSIEDLAAAGLVHTDERGRFSYVAKASRNRLLRFRYPGSRRIRSQTRDVSLAVPAKSTIRASDHSLLVGDAVAFAGRLLTGPVPRGGKLMEVQAFFRGRWRTISTVRSSSRGRWRFEYRFGGTRGTVRYRFRLRIPFEAGYPFATGGSRPTSVSVRGP